MIKLTVNIDIDIHKVAVRTHASAILNDFSRELLGSMKSFNE